MSKVEGSWVRTETGDFEMTFIRGDRRSTLCLDADEVPALLAALLEGAGAQRMVLRTEAGQEIAGYEMWILAISEGTK